MDTIKKNRKLGDVNPNEMLTINIAFTDLNAAFFDVANNSHGCITSIHEDLYRQGILKGT